MELYIRHKAHRTGTCANGDSMKNKRTFSHFIKLTSFPLGWYFWMKEHLWHLIHSFPRQRNTGKGNWSWRWGLCFFTRYLASFICLSGPSEVLIQPNSQTGVLIRQTAVCALETFSLFWISSPKRDNKVCFSLYLNLLPFRLSADYTVSWEPEGS